MNPCSSRSFFANSHILRYPGNISTFTFVKQKNNKPVDKKILRIGLAGLMILIIGLITSSLTPVTPSATNPCKESTPDCSKKKDKETRTDIDLETLSGKFFSSVSY